MTGEAGSNGACPPTCLEHHATLPSYWTALHAPVIPPQPCACNLSSSTPLTPSCSTWKESWTGTQGALASMQTQMHSIPTASTARCMSLLPPCVHPAWAMHASTWHGNSCSHMGLLLLLLLLLQPIGPAWPGLQFQSSAQSCLPKYGSLPAAGWVGEGERPLLPLRQKSELPHLPPLGLPHTHVHTSSPRSEECSPPGPTPSQSRTFASPELLFHFAPTSWDPGTAYGIQDCFQPNRDIWSPYL